MEEITPKNLLTYLSIERKLKGMDKKVVNEYLDWLDTKTTFFADSIKRKSYRPQPDNITMLYGWNLVLILVLNYLITIQKVIMQ